MQMDPLSLALASADAAGAAPVPGGAAEAPFPGMMPGAAPPPGADPLSAAVMGAPGVPSGPLDMQMGGMPPGMPGMEGMDPSGGIPPELAALAGGAQAPAGPMYPTTDPSIMGQVLDGLVKAQQTDHQAMQMDQQEAIMAHPLAQALMAGAPMGPGAGQDGQAIGAPSGDLMMPEGPAEMPY